jgi:hypothetical protein
VVAVSFSTHSPPLLGPGKFARPIFSHTEDNDVLTIEANFTPHTPHMQTTRTSNNNNKKQRTTQYTTLHHTTHNARHTTNEKQSPYPAG